MNKQDKVKQFKESKENLAIEDLLNSTPEVENKPTYLKLGDKLLLKFHSEKGKVIIPMKKRARALRAGIKKLKPRKKTFKRRRSTYKRKRTYRQRSSFKRRRRRY